MKPTPRTQDRHTVTLLLEQRCRALARVAALLEGRRLVVADVRFCPVTPVRARAEAIIDVTGDATVLAEVASRIALLPGVVEVEVRTIPLAETVPAAAPRVVRRHLAAAG